MNKITRKRKWYKLNICKIYDPRSQIYRIYLLYKYGRSYVEIPIVIEKRYYEMVLNTYKSTFSPNQFKRKLKESN